MRAALFVVALYLIAICPSPAQSCPKENPDGQLIESAPQTLTGKVVYHNGLRQWFALQLDEPTCGENVIQLIQGDDGAPKEPSIEVFRGCTVTVYGTLGIPGTGYYSAELYQNVDRIDPSPTCVRRHAFPDYSKVKPNPAIRNYRVSIRIDYLGDHIAITARSGNRILKPWQAYASYMLTGDFGLYAYCADDFYVTHFTGTPEAKPWLIDTYLAIDPETAAQKHVTHLRLDYTCRR